MARHEIPLSEVINDFLLMHKDDDYVNNVDETQVRVYAKRGLRELGFDVTNRVKSILLTLDKSTMSVALPDDYVNYTRIGTIGNDGLFYVFGENPNITAMQRYTEDVNGDPVDSNSDGVYDRTDAKTIVTGTDLPYAEQFYSSRDANYVNAGGGIYGYGGAHRQAYFRVNKEQNRIEISSRADFEEIAIEYLADEARANNPSVHVYAVDALDKYIYSELVKRSAYVPYNEKIRAERDYLSALKLANSRMKSFTKDEALAANRKNYRLSPKF